MGYNSTFIGEYKPSKKIPEDVVARINEASLDVRVSTEDEDLCEAGNVAPWSYEMHGYDFARDLVKVQRLLLRHGITLSGEVERRGDSGDDFERIEARKGRIYQRAGRVVYGKREERGRESVTYYSVRVFRVTKTARGEKRRFVGWASQVRFGKNTGSTVCPPQLVLGKPDMDRPPVMALAFSKKDADTLAGYLSASHPSGKTRYEVISWEDKL